MSGPPESTAESGPLLAGPRTLLGLAGAAAVSALALAPLAIWAPDWPPGPRYIDRTIVVEPPSGPGTQAGPEPGRDVRFDLSVADPSFQGMADRLPAIEGQALAEPPDELAMPLEPVAGYASLAPEPPDPSTESVPIPPVSETIPVPVDEQARNTPADDDRTPVEVAATGSASVENLPQPERQALDRPRAQDSGSRAPRPHAASTEPRAALRPVTASRPRSSPKPSRVASRDAHDAPRSSRAVRPAAGAGGNANSWSLPPALQPTIP